MSNINLHKEEFEGTEGVIRIRKSKKHRQLVKRKSTKGQTTIYITLLRKIYMSSNCKESF
jgi:hypothetical protein